MDSADDDSGGEPNEPARFDPGLKGFDTPANCKRKTNCSVCQRPILRGSFRLCYRFKASTRAADELKVHVDCARRLPEATRLSDVRQVTSWIRGEADAASVAVLSKVLDALGRGSASSSSHAAAPAVA